jgi:hypothetical protein
VILKGTLQPGDVVAVRKTSFAMRMVAFGAALQQLLTGRVKPNLANHIAIVHHTDAAGTLWGIEGRPGGVGWVDMTVYVASPWSMSNALQPKSPAQRKMICDGAVALIGKGYDWEAIAADAAADLDLSGLWHASFHGPVPGHFVCSAVSEYLYLKALLGCPDPVPSARDVQPADWTAFFIEKGWA